MSEAERETRNVPHGDGRLSNRCAHVRVPLWRRRGALTLVELLVVIVILVTLVAGVVPIFSPNNDARKIREAARQLSSMIAQAQSTAARTSRPAGIAFSGLDPATGDPRGVALEAYFIAQPPAFRGFDNDATVEMRAGTGNLAILTFGRGIGEGFQSSDADPSNWLPPRMFKIGDQIVAAGNRFQIAPIGGNNEVEEFLTRDVHGRDTVHSYLAPKQFVDVIWLDWAPGQDRLLPRHGHPYEALRQAQNTSDPPLQFPRGIGIDTTGSEGMGTYSDVRIMFYPSGQVESYFFNGMKDPSPEWFDILIGRAENAKVMPVVMNTSVDPTRPIIPAEYIRDAPEWDEFDFSGNVSDDDLERRRGEVNWLHADSQWIRIASRSGRVITAENGYFDPRIDADTLSAWRQFRRQTNDRSPAKSYLEDMMRTGGG